MFGQSSSSRSRSEILCDSPTQPVPHRVHGLRAPAHIDNHRWRACRPALVGALIGALLLAAAPAQALPQTAADDLKPKDVADAGVIDQVVLYRGRAAVTRTVRRDLPQGVWAIRVNGLPQSVAPQSIQAKVERAAGAGGAGGPGGGGSAAGGGGAGGAGSASAAGSTSNPKLIGVEYAETALAEFGGTPEGIALQKRLEDLKRQQAYLSQDAQILEQQARLVEQVGVRAAANATNDGGTQSLDLEAVAAQLRFVAERRAALVEERRAIDRTFAELTLQIQAAEQEANARGGASRTDRAAIVVVAQPEAGPVEIRVTYVVSGASWEPVYSVRGAGDRTSVEIEYDALVTQRTGEDWRDVRLSLSTAQPTRASSPPAVAPWFVDVLAPMQSGRGGFGRGDVASNAMDRNADEPGDGTGGEAGDMMPGSGAAPGGFDARRKAGIERMARAAEVQETGTAVSFELPRTVTIPTDDAKQQRTRIARIQPEAKFVYAAQPIVTEDVFLRGDLVNASAYQLLPGRAQIFMGGDFIGDTAMPSVAPKDEFKIYFGPDRALRAKRELIARTTGSAGFFGGSEQTTWNYRIVLDNGTGRDVTLELFDRIPVSRNEKIEVRTEDLSRPLSTAKAYVEGAKTQGILRWDLTVPASARPANPMTVAWKVAVSRPNSMQITPLPPD